MEPQKPYAAAASSRSPANHPNVVPQAEELQPLVGTTQFRPVGTCVAQFYDIIAEDDNFKKLGPNETVDVGLRRLDPKLVTDSPGNSGCCARHVVLEGELGLGVQYGQPYFYPPGNYFILGIGRQLLRTVSVRMVAATGGFNALEHMGVTYVDLTEGQVAVIQKGDRQFVLGSGRYLFRAPTTLLGMLKVNELTTKHTVSVQTEKANELQGPPGSITTTTQRNITVKTTVESGQTARAGACTFIRPNPGFQYATLSDDGQYEMGPGFKVARSSEKFICFLDYGIYTRTTAPFRFQAKDFHTGEMAVQMQWRLLDGQAWLQNKGAYEDIFDALEEKVQALFRDMVAGFKHDEALRQRDTGYDDLERKVRPILDECARALGGVLLDIQVQNIVFPAVQDSNRLLASQEADNNAKIMQSKRDLALQEMEDQKRARMKIAEAERQRREAEDRSKLFLIENERALTEVKAKAEQMKAQEVAEAQRLEAHLEAENHQAQLKAKQQEILAQAAALSAKIEADQRAQNYMTEAKAKADAQLLADQSRAEGELALARARAKAAADMGQAMRDNPQVYELERVRIDSEHMRAVSANLADALRANPTAVLTQTAADEWRRMLQGFAPQIPAVSFAALPAVGPAPAPGGRH